MYDMCTQLYDKTKEKIYPTTFASCVSVTNNEFNNAQDAIDTLKGEISGLLDDVKDLIKDVEYLKEHGGGSGGTVVVQPAVNVTIHNFPSRLSGTINLFDYQDIISNISNPYATFTYSNIDNPTTYTAVIEVYGKSITKTGEIQANESTEIYFDQLPVYITPGTKTVKVTVTIEGVSGSASKSFTAKVPSMFIWHEADNVNNLPISNPDHQELTLSDLSGQYAPPGGKYLWIVTTNKLKKLVIGNITAPYESSTKIDSEYNITYNCYRTLTKPDLGVTLNIEVQ